MKKAIEGAMKKLESPMAAATDMDGGPTNGRPFLTTRAAATSRAAAFLPR